MLSQFYMCIDSSFIEVQRLLDFKALYKSNGCFIHSHTKHVHPSVFHRKSVWLRLIAGLSLCIVLKNLMLHHSKMLVAERVAAALYLPELFPCQFPGHRGKPGAEVPGWFNVRGRVARRHPGPQDGASGLFLRRDDRHRC